MGKGGGGSSTTVQKADPWKAAQPFLLEGLENLRNTYESGELTPTPYGGQRVASFNPMQIDAYRMARGQMNQGAPATEAARSGMMDMMSGEGVYRDLDAVRQDALGSAVPAATAMFAGNGMTDSTMAMDTVGRAATQAVAPIEYGAWDAAQDRRMKAGAIAPSLDAAAYLPAQMGMQFGGMSQGQMQATLDDKMARHYERQNIPWQNLSRYSNLAMGYGGIGGTQSSSGSQPGPSTGARIAGAGLGGLGAYGALSMNPATAPFAIPGGIAAGLLGLL